MAIDIPDLPEFKGVVSASGALMSGGYYRVDASQRNVTLALPSGARAGARIVVERIDDNPAFIVLVSGTIRGLLNQTAPLEGAYDTITLTSEGFDSWRIESDARPVALFDRRFEGKLPTGTGSQFLTGAKTFRAVTKADVGLGNVDNTADVDKPISSATGAALDGLDQRTTSLEQFAVRSDFIDAIWSGTQADYAALPSYDPRTLYFVTS